MDAFFDNFALIHNYSEYNCGNKNLTITNSTDIQTFIHNSIQNKFPLVSKCLNVISQQYPDAKKLPEFYITKIEEVLSCEIFLSFLYTAEYLRHSAYRLPLHQVFYEYKPLNSHVRMPPAKLSDNNYPPLIETILNLQKTSQFKEDAKCHIQSITGEYIKKYNNYARNVQKCKNINSFSCIFQDISNKSEKYFLPAWLYPVPVIIHNNQIIKKKGKFEQLYDDINYYNRNEVYDILIRYKLEHLYHHRQIDSLCEKFLLWKQFDCPYPTYNESINAFPNENQLFNPDFFSLIRNNTLVNLVPFIDLYVNYSWVLSEFYGKNIMIYLPFSNYLKECLHNFEVLKNDSLDLFASLWNHKKSLTNISSMSLDFLNKSSYFNTFYSPKNLLLNYKNIIDSKSPTDNFLKSGIIKSFF